MRPALACLLLVALAASPAPVAANEPVGAPELRRILDQSVDLRLAGRRISTPRLRAFYRLRGFAAAWDLSDAGGERSDALVRVLSQAADHGLDPAVYHLDAVSPGARTTSALGRELLLTDALLRYAQDVRIGRVRPRAIDGDWGILGTDLRCRDGGGRRPRVGRVRRLAGGTRAGPPRLPAAGREPDPVSDSRGVPDALRDIDWVLRDHRTDQVHEIDRGLLQLLGAIRSRLDTAEPFEIISAYRSPATNALLQATTTGVAANSLHPRGMAVDLRVPARPLLRVRAAALALRRGGVGDYPESDFVHIDVGRVRRW